MLDAFGQAIIIAAKPAVWGLARCKPMRKWINNRILNLAMNLASIALHRNPNAIAIAVAAGLLATC
jgi:hypothetical protein